MWSLIRLYTHCTLQVPVPLDQHIPPTSSPYTVCIHPSQNFGHVIWKACTTSLQPKKWHSQLVNTDFEYLLLSCHCADMCDLRGEKSALRIFKIKWSNRIKSFYCKIIIGLILCPALCPQFSEADRGFHCINPHTFPELLNMEFSCVYI